MKTYARMESGIAQELFSTDGDIEQMFHPSIQWENVTGRSPAPQVGWTFDGSTWSTPAGPSAEALWKVYQAEALAALTKSDTTLLRCTEIGAAVPAAWATYRQALRAIVGTATGTATSLPAVPPYP